MRAGVAAALAGAALLFCVASHAQTAVPLRVVGDAIPDPLTTEPGDAARGRAIVASRQGGLCLLCHSGPFPEDRFQGDLAPSLEGAGARWSAGQLRLRIADGRRLNSQSVMPSYHRTDNLQRVGSTWRDKPILNAQQVEDVVAYLLTLKMTLIHRRGVIQLGGALATGVLVRPARATSSEMEASIRGYANGAPVTVGKVKLDVSPLVENGNAVPITVTVESPMTAAQHVTGIAVFNDRNPQRDVVRFVLSPRSGRAVVSTRIRLATSQQLVAVARFSDGSFWSHRVDVLVTLAACLE